MEYNSKCSICGKPYHRCNSCVDQKLKPWLSVVDNMNHYKIYLVISDYVKKKTSKEKAKGMLEKCDISDYKTFVPEIASVIEDITKEVKTQKKVKREIKAVESEDETVIE